MFCGIIVTDNRSLETLVKNCQYMNINEFVGKQMNCSLMALNRSLQ